MELEVQAILLNKSSRKSQLHELLQFKRSFYPISHPASLSLLLPLLQTAPFSCLIQSFGRSIYQFQQQLHRLQGVAMSQELKLLILEMLISIVNEGGIGIPMKWLPIVGQAWRDRLFQLIQKIINHSDFLHHPHLSYFLSYLSSFSLIHSNSPFLSTLIKSLALTNDSRVFSLVIKNFKIEGNKARLVQRVRQEEEWMGLLELLAHGSNVGMCKQVEMEELFLDDQLYKVMLQTLSLSSSSSKRTSLYKLLQCLDYFPQELDHILLMNLQEESEQNIVEIFKVLMNVDGVVDNGNIEEWKWKNAIQKIINKSFKFEVLQLGKQILDSFKY